MGIHSLHLEIIYDKLIELQWVPWNAHTCIRVHIHTYKIL